MKLSDFDYTLPQELIAYHPVPDRVSSRLLVLDRTDGTVRHKHFRDLSEYIQPGDALILNDTRVIPARLHGKRASGGKVEMLLLRELGPARWEALLRPSVRVREGDEILISEISKEEKFSAVAMNAPENGGARRLHFSPPAQFREMLARFGKIPLPPYIKRAVEIEDAFCYQTVFAKRDGAVAAPTAGLHFDEAYLEALKNSGVCIAHITLHVGYGTFQTLFEEDLKKQTLHEEYFQVEDSVIQLIQSTRAAGRKVFVCGTTALRALESCKMPDGALRASSGKTDIFIYPPYKITTADALITNFHMPRTSLMLLTSAFAGREHMLNAYELAIRRRYRFASFGDAMLIV